MWYLVGLGNPGKEYEQTRHNVGWMALDSIVERFQLPKPVSSRAYAGHVSEGVIEGQEVTVLYPDTFMNASGSAVKKLVPQSEVDSLIVFYDDVDLPIGAVKISLDRGDGGHNGVRSIHEALQSKAFIRVRIGIARKSIFGTVRRPHGEALSRYVLAPFTEKEHMIIRRVCARLETVLELILTKGPAAAMQEYNGKNDMLPEELRKELGENGDD